MLCHISDRTNALFSIEVHDSVGHGLLITRVWLILIDRHGPPASISPGCGQ